MTIDTHPLGLEYLEPAFELATQVFASESTLHRALGIGLSEYQSYLRRPFESMVREGLSIAATDRGSGRLVGCLMLTDFAGALSDGADPPPALAPLAALTAQIGRRYKALREITVGEAVLVDMGAVSKEATGCGVYQRMRAAAHETARARGFRWVLGELSSAATQHVVLNRLGHRNMAEIVFADFVFGGARPFQEIRDPVSLVLSEGDL